MAAKGRYKNYFDKESTKDIYDFTERDFMMKREIEYSNLPRQPYGLILAKELFKLTEKRSFTGVELAEYELVKDSPSALKVFLRKITYNQDSPVKNKQVIKSKESYKEFKSRLAATIEEYEKTREKIFGPRKLKKQEQEPDYIWRTTKNSKKNLLFI